MSRWTILALGPADAVEGCSWRDACHAASSVAAEHGQMFELLLVGSALPDGEGWPRLSGVTLLRTTDDLDSIAAIGGIAADFLASRPHATLVIVPPGPSGEELAATIAARANGRALGRARAIRLDEGAVAVTRAAFGGRAEIDVAYPAGLSVATLRGTVSNDPAAVLPAVTVVECGAGPETGVSIDRIPATLRDVPLEGARLVVSGGRGLDEAAFGLLQEIADAVGGAVGGSLPAVDAGLVGVSRQVGQSGKFVTPELYVAVGLSGTPQHLAGIGPATRIVAINKDPAAPIFNYAELGAVADAKEVLPLLRDMLASGEDRARGREDVR